MNLEEQIRNTGFVCQCCGACCSGSDNEVMVSPEEIDLLIQITGLRFEDIVEPYPEWIEGNGEIFTFGWVLRRGKDGNCLFLKNNRCSVYAVRPYICRTYPFMLNHDELIISECDAIPGTAPCHEAKNLFSNLLKRRDAEEREFLQTKEQYQKHSISPGATLVFDSRGAHPWLKKQ